MTDPIASFASLSLLQPSSTSSIVPFQQKESDHDEKEQNSSITVKYGDSSITSSQPMKDDRLELINQLIKNRLLQDMEKSRSPVQEMKIIEADMKRIIESLTKLFPALQIGMLTKEQFSPKLNDQKCLNFFKDAYETYLKNYSDGVQGQFFRIPLIEHYLNQIFPQYAFKVFFNEDFQFTTSGDGTRAIPSPLPTP